MLVQDICQSGHWRYVPTKCGKLSSTLNTPCLLTWVGTLWAIWRACEQCYSLLCLLAKNWTRSVSIDDQDEMYENLRDYFTTISEKDAPAFLKAFTTHLEAWNLDSSHLTRPEGQQYWNFSGGGIMTVMRGQNALTGTKTNRFRADRVWPGHWYNSPYLF